MIGKSRKETRFLYHYRPRRTGAKEKEIAKWHLPEDF